MNDHVCKMIEIVGISQKSSDDAIATAIDKASKTLHNLNWFEVAQIRQNGQRQGRTLPGNPQGWLPS